MEKEQILIKAKTIIKNAYRALDDLAKEVKAEALVEDKITDKINQIAIDTHKIRVGVIG